LAANYFPTSTYYRNARDERLSIILLETGPWQIARLAISEQSALVIRARAPVMLTDLP
jgi:hypothetical protein